MTTRPFSELVDLMARTVVPDPSQDKLDHITDRMREARNLHFEIKDLEEKIKDTKKLYHTLVHQELPDLMNEINQGFLRLEAEGNHPPFTYNLKPFYKANIQTESETSSEAFAWLESHGEGDLIKRTVSASLGRNSQQLQEELVAFLDERNVDCDIKLGVPWNTLTAWLKERHNQYMNQSMSQHTSTDDIIEMPPLDIFGATIGQVVEIKEVKPK